MRGKKQKKCCNSFRLKKDYFFKDGQVLAMDHKKDVEWTKHIGVFGLLNILTQSNSIIDEKVCVGHYSFQPIHHGMGCPRRFGVHHQKDNGRDALSTPIRYYKNTSQVGQGKEKEKQKEREATIYQKSLHQTPCLIERDGRFLFSRGCMQPRYWL